MEALNVLVDGDEVQVDLSGKEAAEKSRECGKGEVVLRRA